MRKETLVSDEQISEHIESKKREFRQHQRNLSFSEKMRIAFSLAERDRAISRAVLLPKTKRISKII